MYRQDRQGRQEKKERQERQESKEKQERQDRCAHTCVPSSPKRELTGGCSCINERT